MKKSKHEPNTKSNSEKDLRIANLKSLTLHLAKRNDALQDIKSHIIQLKKEPYNDKYYKAIINHVKLQLTDSKDWDVFNCYFNNLYPNFYSKVIRFYPDISTHELHLMALLKLNLSNQQILRILHISHEGIKKARYRLRKKMSLKTSESLEETILSM